MTVASVYDDGMRTVLKDARSLWWHAGFMAAGIMTLSLSWSTDSLDDFLASGSPPDTFSAMVLVLAVFLLALGGAFTLDRVSKDPGHPFVRWIRYTPVSPASYLAGRSLFHLVHTLSLLILIWPFLLIAGAAAYVPWGSMFSVAAYMGFLSFSLRIMAEAGRRLDRPTGSLGYLVYAVVVISYSLLVNATFSQWSLIETLKAMIDPNRNAGALVARTAGLHGLLAMLAGIVTFIRLRIAARIEATW